jgi:hypothetical protein
MHRRRLEFILAGLVVTAGMTTPAFTLGAVPNSLILNEANTVSGTNFLGGGNVDTSFGRLQGNGQNWLEFLVVQGDPKPGGGFQNTLDLRGWKMHWSYDKDNLHASVGSGDIVFSDDPLWSAVPRGTMITVSEWSDVWYDTNSAPSFVRAGGFNGLGHLRNLAYDKNIHTRIGGVAFDQTSFYATNTDWNPAANNDWNIHVFAGDNLQGTSGKYFSFTGSVTTSQGTFPVGTDDGGLFTANNDNWQYTISDKPLPGQDPNIIQGPFGEQDTGLGSSWRVGSDEIVRLEGFDGTPTQSTYLGATILDYADGTSSTFGKPNTWSQGSGHQQLGSLRSWLLPGDADLDGAVTAADYVLIRKNSGSPGGWMQGDLSGNGTVDSADLDIWRAHFGESSAGGSAAGTTVPEPAVFSLITAIALALSARRTRDRFLL